MDQNPNWGPSSITLTTARLLDVFRPKTSADFLPEADVRHGWPGMFYPWRGAALLLREQARAILNGPFEDPIAVGFFPFMPAAPSTPCWTWYVGRNCRALHLVRGLCLPLVEQRVTATRAPEPSRVLSRRGWSPGSLQDDPLGLRWGFGLDREGDRCLSVERISSPTSRFGRDRYLRGGHDGLRGDGLRYGETHGEDVPGLRSTGLVVSQAVHGIQLPQVGVQGSSDA